MILLFIPNHLQNKYFSGPYKMPDINHCNDLHHLSATPENTQLPMSNIKVFLDDGHYNPFSEAVDLFP
ncbi:MAG: hypothetical protein IPH68_14620 [Chitinophagaceae bacterium]|nr:hypothetical protein [Chitinophagaceae bacterium]